MTINELSDNELTLLSSLIKQNKDKLKEIITGANKVNDVRTTPPLLVHVLFHLFQKYIQNT
jgi:hypothetical protein